MRPFDISLILKTFQFSSSQCANNIQVKPRPLHALVLIELNGSRQLTSRGLIALSN
jgi:hypothetical protein